MDLGRSQAAEGQSSHPASSLVGAWVEERELSNQQGASSSFFSESNLGLGETSPASLLPRSLSSEQNGELAEATAHASWGHSQAAFCAVLARHPSLHEKDHHNHSLGEQERQATALRSSCPMDLGRSQAAEGQSSHPASSLVGAWVEERELSSQQFAQLRAEMKSLRECVDHLVSLLDSHHKENLRNFQELHDSIGKAKLTKGEANRVDFTQHKQQQLQQQEQQESEGRGCLQEGCLGVPGVLPDIF